MQGECPCSPEASAFSRPGVADYLANYLHLYGTLLLEEQGRQTRDGESDFGAPSRRAVRRVISMLDNAG